MPSKAKTLTYSEKLRDPRWQKMRLKIMERDQFTCQSCFSKTRFLNVHHKKYAPGCEPWEYPSEILITLCESCHKSEHAQTTTTAPKSRPTPKLGSNVNGWMRQRPLMFLDLERLKGMVATMESADVSPDKFQKLVEIVNQMELERDTVKEDTTTLQDSINGMGEAIH